MTTRKFERAEAEKFVARLAEKIGADWCVQLMEANYVFEGDEEEVPSGWLFVYSTNFVDAFQSGCLYVVYQHGDGYRDYDYENQEFGLVAASLDMLADRTAEVYAEIEK